jgi:hypothetical protein
MTAMMLWCRVTVLGPDRNELGGFVLEGPGPPDLGVVETVARLALMAGRCGGAVVLGQVSPRLGELLALAGLSVEVEGEAESGKKALRVQGMEKEAQLGDLPA